MEACNAHEPAHHLGPRRDTRNIVIAVLRQATEPLTTPQIIALARPTRTSSFQHLRELETQGLVRRLGDGSGRKPQRWYWRTDLDEVAAS